MVPINDLKMKEYKLNNFSIKKLSLYTVVSFIIIILFTVLTSIYFNPKIYPAIVLFILSVISFVLIKKNSMNTYNISLDNNYISFNNKKIDLSHISNYSFSETENYYGCRLVFSSYKIFLNIPKKETSDYLDFKKHFIEIINLKNKDRINNPIIEYNWYKTKSSRIYGYFVISIMLTWLMLMIIFPGKLNLSNIGLFLIVTAGLSPIVYRIFGNDRFK